MIQRGIQYITRENYFAVRYYAPTRTYSDIRTEFNNDAKLISTTYGDVYIAFSSGVDSQIIARCFIDQGLDCQFIFLYTPGYNDIEYQHVLECEKFFNIKVRVLTLYIDQHKDEWITRASQETNPAMYHYPFEWLCDQMDDNIPIISQGSIEPAIIGINSDLASIYHNHSETMERRFSLMKKRNIILDFPFSPESVASYYTDDIIQSYCHSLQYFNENKLSNSGNPIHQLQYFNTYAKSIVKARYFKDDIKWYGKLSGYENYPDWFSETTVYKYAHISVPYWSLVSFLSNNRNVSCDFSGWQYKE